MRFRLFDFQPFYELSVLLGREPNPFLFALGH